MSIQRYGLHWCIAPSALSPLSNGAWVSYSDHATLLAAKDEEIVKLRKCLADVLACINETRGKNADEAVYAARQALKESPHA